MFQEQRANPGALQKSSLRNIFRKYGGACKKSVVSGGYVQNVRCVRIGHNWLLLIKK